jgi:hypothetical protein
MSESSMAKTPNDPKERLALSTPAIKRALKAAAIRDKKIRVALGVAKPVRLEQEVAIPAAKSTRSTSDKPLLTPPPAALRKALKEAARDAHRLATAYGAKIPVTSKDKTTR